MQSELTLEIRIADLDEVQAIVAELKAERDALRAALRRVTTGLECPYPSCESELCAAIRQASAALGEED